VLHPVGPLPAAVYWRRRALVLTLLLSVLGGGGWVGWAVATGRSAEETTTASATGSAGSTSPPALERVVPALASVQLPTAPTTAVVPTTPTAPLPAPGSPCTDDMLSLEARAPAAAPAADKPTFELVVTNTSPVPCVRALDQQVQEFVLLDATGARVWGSNDCFPGTTGDLRTLVPGQPVSLPVQWGGLTSEPTCTAPRVAPPPGAYVLRGRLDTKVSTDAAFAVV
jgi:hypothetical protein